MSAGNCYSSGASPSGATSDAGFSGAPLLEAESAGSEAGFTDAEVASASGSTFTGVAGEGVAVPTVGVALSTSAAALGAVVSAGGASNLGDNTLANRSTIVFAAFESASRVGL